MIEVETIPAIYPPRPQGAFPAQDLARLRGYLAQYKYNDIRILISVHADRGVEILSRRREPLKSPEPLRQVTEALKAMRLVGGGLYLFDGGYLRSAFRPGRPKPVILWDILIDGSHYLTGTTYQERYDRLASLIKRAPSFERQSHRKLGLEITPDVWLAPNLEGDYLRLYERLKPWDDIEGLVLKNPRGKLEWGASEENNAAWQIRVRKPSLRHLV